MPIISLGNTIANTGGLFGPPAPVPIVDVDALTYVNAVNAAMAPATLSDPIRQALDAFVIGLKADGNWSTLLYLWPLIGNQDAQRYNLRNTATGLITWSGTGTYDTATGYTPGSDGYGDTGLTGSAVTIQSGSFGAYIRSDSTNVNAQVMGCLDDNHNLIVRDGFQQCKIGSATLASGAYAQPNGYWAANRSTLDVTLNNNGSSLGFGNGSGSTSGSRMFLGAVNNGSNVVLANSHSEARSFGAFFWGTGIDHAALSSRISTLQFALGRLVTLT